MQYCSPPCCARPRRRAGPTGQKLRTRSIRGTCREESSIGWKNSHALSKPNARTCTRGFTAPMLADYLQGTVPQLVERARLLKGKIPRGLPRDYEALIKTCHDELDNIIARLRELQAGTPAASLAVRHAKLRQFKRAVADLDIVERVPSRRCIASMMMIIMLTACSTGYARRSPTRPCRRRSARCRRDISTSIRA